MNVIDRIENIRLTCTNSVIGKTISLPDLKELIELAKIGQQMQWVSVSERLPEKPLYDWVLVQTKLVPENWYGVPHIAELRNGVWYSDRHDTPLEETCGVVVTHWMPLLPAPN